eukprot:gene11142-biopygen1708
MLVFPLELFPLGEKAYIILHGMPHGMPHGSTAEHGTFCATRRDTALHGATQRHTALCSATRCYTAAHGTT